MLRFGLPLVVSEVIVSRDSDWLTIADIAMSGTDAAANSSQRQQRHKRLDPACLERADTLANATIQRWRYKASAGRTFFCSFALEERDYTFQIIWCLRERT